MYIVGFVIFAVYMYFTIWNINNGSKKQEQNPPQDYDVVDFDGMGNFSRFPNKVKK
jgi:hypothetical protein